MEDGKVHLIVPDSSNLAQIFTFSQQLSKTLSHLYGNILSLVNSRYRASKLNGVGFPDSPPLNVLAG